MRRNLLKAASLVAILLTAAPAARADIPVIDPSAIAQLLNEVEQMKQAYKVALGTLGTLIPSLNPNGMATNIIGMQPQPSMPNISGMMLGGNNFGSMSGMAQQFQSANTFYMPQSTGSNDLSASLLSRNSNSLASIQAMLMTQVNAVQSHMAGLNSIQSSLSTVGSQADLTAIQSRIAAESANMNAQGVQINALVGMMGAQQNQYQLMQQQALRRSADCLLASVGGGGSCPATTSGGTTLSASLGSGGGWSSLGTGSLPSVASLGASPAAVTSGVPLAGSGPNANALPLGLPTSAASGDPTAANALPLPPSAAEVQQAQINQNYQTTVDNLTAANAEGDSVQELSGTPVSDGIPPH